MSKFKRAQEEEAPRFGSMNQNKVAPPPDEKTSRIENFYIAKKMMECFCYRRWMSDDNVVGPNGERINTRGEVFIPDPPKWRRND